MAEVRLSEVRKVYPGGFEAVKSFDLSILDGEFVVLVGPSGCGKSTTLRMVAGLEEITSGTIEIGGRVVNNIHPKDRDIAMVFQNYALYPHMTVRKNMAFALKLRKIPKAEVERRVRDAAEMLGITELLDRKPKQLSGGQRQRVAVGRCIVREPKAFLFDEPLSNLDAKLRVTTRAELKQLHHRLKTTTIYVTHDQEEAMTLGDRVVVMSDGVIQQADAPLETYANPVNRFVASFIGMPPMNFFEGELVGEGGVLWFVDGSKDAERRGQKLRVSDRHAGMLGEKVGSRVTLGVRPEFFAVADGKDAGSTYEVGVDVVEPLGSHMDVFCTNGEKSNIVARVPAFSKTSVGERLRLGVDMDRVSYFADGEFGENLVHPARARAGAMAGEGA